MQMGGALTPWLERDGVTLYCGAAELVLRELESESVDVAVTSPPYWSLRDYGADGQLGLEATPQEFVDRLVETLRELRRVLRRDGTLWLNLGDSYASSGSGYNVDPHGGAHRAATASDGYAREQSAKRTTTPRRAQVVDGKRADAGGTTAIRPPAAPGLKPKDLAGVPWRVALALQEDGWWLRADVIWDKPNAMPESVTDRPTLAHEHVFMLTRSRRYYYDREAALEPYEAPEHVNRTPSPLYNPNQPAGKRAHTGLHPVAAGPDGRRQTRVAAGDGSIQHRNGERWPHPDGRNARSVWHIATQPYKRSHFATFPEELARRCIASSSRAGGIVLDPFAGTGTALLVARRLGRSAIGIELSEDYCELAARRVLGIQTRWLPDDFTPAECGTEPLWRDEEVPA